MNIITNAGQYLKIEAFRCPEFLAFIRTLRCLKCGQPGWPDDPIEAAHQSHGHGYMAGKPSDFTAVPLHSSEHVPIEHHKGNKTFWDGWDLPRISLIYVNAFFYLKSHGVKFK